LLARQPVYLFNLNAHLFQKFYYKINDIHI
jgi:hypothetical protein